MQRVLGIDPGTSATGLAWLDKHPDGTVEIHKLAVGRGTERTKHGKLCQHAWFASALKEEVDLVIVEGQELYGGHPNPNNIITLAQVAGVYFGALSCTAKDMMPKPKEWKGSIKKHVHQSRSYLKFDIPHDVVGDPRKNSAYCRPQDPTLGGAFPDIKPVDWKELGDALGLALWGLDRLRY